MALDIKRLRTDFAKAAQDGKISDTDVEGLLRRVKRDGITESEAKTLKTETARYKDQFTTEGARRSTPSSRRSCAPPRCSMIRRR